MLSALESATTFTVTGDQLTGAPETSIKPEERLYNYNWCVGWNPYAGWKVMSHEKGTHKKVGSEWQWKDLEHINFSVDGEPSYLTVTVTPNGVAIPVIGTLAAGITVQCNIKARGFYKGSPLGMPSSNVSANSPVFYSNILVI